MHLHCGALQTCVHEKDINSSTAYEAGRPSIQSIARAVASPLPWIHPFLIGPRISGLASNTLFQTAVGNRHTDRACTSSPNKEEASVLQCFLVWNRTVGTYER